LKIRTKYKASFLLLLLCLLGYVCYRRLLPDCKICEPFQVAEKYSKTHKNIDANPILIIKKVKSKAQEAKLFAEKNNMNKQISFLINMSQPSGQKRFYVYDLQKDSILDTGLVAHGSGNQLFAEMPVFSNVYGSGLSSLGKYKVGVKYEGQFGTAFKLHGMESTNSNAFTRSIVLHSYSCVPNNETYPNSICNSLGCPMVNKQFMQKLITILQREKKPILLWVFV
jgi:hypothetical protein